MKKFRILWLLIALLFVKFLLVLGCTETPQETVHPETSETPPVSVVEMETDPLLTDVPMERPHIDMSKYQVQIYTVDAVILPPPVEPIHRETFEKLWELQELFQGTVLADNFRILRILVDSQIYRSYLTQNFNREPDFETLDTFWRMTLPPIPTEKYRPLFEGFLENPQAEDFAYLHRRVLEGKGDSTIHPVLSPPRPDLAPAQLLHHFRPKHPFFATPLHELTKDTVRKWLMHDEKGFKMLEKTLEQNIILAEIENDKKRVRGFFNEYGADAGLVMLALQDPDLMGLILWYSIDEAMFMAWVNRF